MNTELFFNKICEEAWLFEKISLDNMENVKLMDRVDVKYLIPLHLVHQILSEAKRHYKMLEINNQRLCTYETLYYDTEGLDLYHSHQTGRLNRYKVRFRNYVGSDLGYFEVKHKTNKGRTIKKRIKQPNENTNVLNLEKIDFLEKNTPLKAEKLLGDLMVQYKRMTLVNPVSKERLTIDLDLTFIRNQKRVKYNQLVVAEVKQERIAASPIVDIFKQHNLRPGSISKYCLGVLSTHENIKYNRFKSKLLHLKKTVHQYDSFTATSS
jgi:VTC domain